MSLTPHFFIFNSSLKNNKIRISIEFNKNIVSSKEIYFKHLCAKSIFLELLSNRNINNWKAFWIGNFDGGYTILTPPIIIDEYVDLQDLLLFIEDFIEGDTSEKYDMTYFETFELVLDQI